MLNVTFLIGNGFDLNLGLKTSYKNFIEYYLSDTKGDSVIIAAFKDNIDRNKKNWSDAEIEFGNYTENYSDEDGYMFRICYNDFYLKMRHYLKEQEHLVKKEHLDKIEEGIINLFNNFKEDFRTQRKAIINKHISSYSGGYNYNILNFNYTRVIDKCFINNKNEIALKTHQRNNYASLINSPIHIHGTLDHSMVFGVNDESQIKNISIFNNIDSEFLEQFIKPSANEMNEEEIDIIGEQIIGDSHIIYVYGMSFGASDTIWWKRIVERLNTDKHSQLLIYDHDAPERELNSTEFKAYENKLRTKIINYCGLDDNSEIQSIRDRIHIDSKNHLESVKNIIK